MSSMTKIVRYEYDAVGNRKLMVDPDGGRFTYAYDSLNRISHLVNPQAEHTTYAYDANGRRTLKLLANGTRASFIYDDADNLITLGNLKSDGSIISQFDYQYDKAGSRTAVLEADGSRVTWSYDVTYQLTAEHRTGNTPYRNTFTFDAGGNRTLKNEDGVRTTYAYDPANQLMYAEAAAGRTTYVFDADGNQQLEIEPTGDRTTTTWDFENRTTLVQLPTDIRNTMTYEPDGLRITLEESAGTKRFVWDDQNYLAETDENNDTQVVYTNELAYYGNLISQYRRTNGLWLPSYCHYDVLGSTRKLTDTNQDVTETYHYNAWGETLASTAMTVNPFRYIGELGYHYDEPRATYCVRERTYTPELARWTSADPWLRLELNQADFGRKMVRRNILARGGTNLYAYVDASPVIWVDPSGLERECPDGQKSQPRPNYTPGPPNGCTNSPDCPLHGANFRGACDVHDNCYGRCNKSKSECDLNFAFGLVHACVQADANLPGWRCKGGWWGLSICIGIAREYVRFVDSEIGLLFYRNAQRKACICVPKC